jgi:hypothetical protein
MTDEELKALVAENSRAIRAMREEGEKSRQRWEKSQQEAEKARQLADQRWEKSQQEAAQRWEKFQEEIHASRQEMDRAMRGFHKEQGRHAQRFGDHVEAMFFPSLERVLEEDFGMMFSSRRSKVRKDKERHEFDMIAHAGPKVPEVYLIEIKAKLRQESIDQILRKLRQLPNHLPEHRGKKIFGILAAIEIPDDLRIQASRKGLYLATIRDDVFEISPPEDFKPQAFGLRVSQ